MVKRFRGWPDLFAAAIAEVPIADMLRCETTANGEGNVTEFGGVKTEEGFEDLYAINPYAHVREWSEVPGGDGHDVDQ